MHAPAVALSRNGHDSEKTLVLHAAPTHFDVADFFSTFASKYQKSLECSPALVLPLDNWKKCTA